MIDNMDVLKVILFLIGFCSLLYLTYVTTRYIGGKQKAAMRGKNISIEETVSLGMDKRIHLIKAGKQYFLIASASKTIEFLTNVEIDEQPPADEIVTNENNERLDFKSIFEKYAGIYREKAGKKRESQNIESHENFYEEQNFKTNLKRLRSILHNNNRQQIDKNEGEDTGEE